MWRALFLAIGVSMVIMGAECLAVDKVVLNAKETPVRSDSLLFIQPQQIKPQPREVEPPEWAPWSLLGGGTLIVIYSLTLRRGG